MLLFVLSLTAFSSCKKTSENEVLLTSNTWIDESGVEWTFSSNGKLKVVSGDETGNGTWSYTESNNTLIRTYSFGSDDISCNDRILSIDDDILVLESLDFEGETTTFYNATNYPTPTPEPTSVLDGTNWLNQSSWWEYLGSESWGGTYVIHNNNLHFKDNRANMYIVDTIRKYQAGAYASGQYYSEEISKVQISLFSYYFNEETGEGDMARYNDVGAILVYDFTINGDTLSAVDWWDVPGGSFYRIH